MRRSQIRHITDPIATVAVNDPELVFTGFITDGAEIASHTSHTPHDFEHVRHLVGDLYFAWSSADPSEGWVFIRSSERRGTE